MNKFYTNFYVTYNVIGRTLHSFPWFRIWRAVLKIPKIVFWYWSHWQRKQNEWMALIQLKTHNLPSLMIITGCIVLIRIIESTISEFNVVPNTTVLTDKSQIFLCLYGSSPIWQLIWSIFWYLKGSLSFYLVMTDWILLLHTL